MKVLFIGGTGNISRAVSELAAEQAIDLTLLNRGKQGDLPGTKSLAGDIHREDETAALLEGRHWDCVVNWIAYTPADVERDIRLFSGKTSQYIFISSASCYQKPPLQPLITEATPLHNPYWEYSRNKIACEDRLMQAYRDSGFPVTIVRPSHTYDRMLPIPFGGSCESTVIDRMKRGLPILIHGDGTSLWVVTHSRDFARGFTGLLGNPLAIGSAYHITSDEVLTWNQIITAIADAVGVQATIVHVSSEMLIRRFPNLEGPLLGDKAHSVIFDNSRIRTLVPTFSCTVPFHRGIVETVEKFAADPLLNRVFAENYRRYDLLIEELGGR